jgi:hypothetical protein
MRRGWHASGQTRVLRRTCMAGSASSSHAASCACCALGSAGSPSPSALPASPDRVALQRSSRVTDHTDRTAAVRPTPARRSRQPGRPTCCAASSSAGLNSSSPRPFGTAALAPPHPGSSRHGPALLVWLGGRAAASLSSASSSSAGSAWKPAVSAAAHTPGGAAASPGRPHAAAPARHSSGAAQRSSARRAISRWVFFRV